MARPAEGGTRDDAGTEDVGDLAALRQEVAELKAEVARRDGALRDFLATVCAASRTVQLSSERLRKCV